MDSAVSTGMGRQLILPEVLPKPLVGISQEVPGLWAAFSRNLIFVPKGKEGFAGIRVI